MVRVGQPPLVLMIETGRSRAISGFRQAPSQEPFNAVCLQRSGPIALLISQMERHRDGVSEDVMVGYLRKVKGEGSLVMYTVWYVV